MADALLADNRYRRNFLWMIRDSVLILCLPHDFIGRIFDSHSTFVPGKPGECTEGIDCYRDAYFITLLASMGGLGLSLFIITRNRRLAKEAAAGED